jgi:NitT/TauT family transport system permease protein
VQIEAEIGGIALLRNALQLVLQSLGKLWQLLYGLAAVLVFLALWEIAPRVGLTDPEFLPPFSSVAVAFWHLLITGELIVDVLISAQRALIGFGLAMVIAIPVGLALGWFEPVQRFFEPLLQTFRQTAALALLPVFMLFFGIGEMSKVAIIFWSAQWPILLNTIAGVKSVDPLLIKSARAMGASPLTLFLKVILPGSLPSIFTGIRLSSTDAILMLLVAEMMGSNAGVGYLLYWSEEHSQIPNMYVAIVALALLGLILNYLLVAAERRFSRWKEDLTFR